MDPLTLAMIASSVIGAGSSLMGADKAAEGAEAGNELLEKRYQEGKNLLLPYMKGSQSALNLYGNAVGAFGPGAQSAFYNNFQHDPGFDEALNNSLDETTRRYSIMGRTGGGFANALLKTGQGARLGAYKDRLNQLMGLADFGRGTAGTIANMGQQSAAGQAANLGAAGQYQGAGIVNAGNALIGGLNNYATLGQNANGTATGMSPANRPWDTFTVNNRAMF
jgi:hypothetical protein